MRLGFIPFSVTQISEPKSLFLISHQTMNSQPGLFGATVVDVDINTGVNLNNNLPMWLRDVLSRALNANGIHTQKKLASDGAIESLVEVEVDKLKDRDCPICFEPYEDIKMKEGDVKMQEQLDLKCLEINGEEIKGSGDQKLVKSKKLSQTLTLGPRHRSPFTSPIKLSGPLSTSRSSA